MPITPHDDEIPFSEVRDIEPMEQPSPMPRFNKPPRPQSEMNLDDDGFGVCIGVFFIIFSFVVGFLNGVSK